MMVQSNRMEIAVADAKPIFSELLRRANAGEEVVVTRHGRPYARIAPIERPRGLPPGQRLAAIKAIMDESRRLGFAQLGIDAVTSQDFLYDPETGLPF